MAKNLEELDDDIEEEAEEEIKEEKEDKKPESSPQVDFCKKIVIDEITRIINDYKQIEIAKNEDKPLLEAFEKKKDIDLINCINHVENKLVEKRICGGADSIMYEYIHEYYVDNFEIVEDKWSNYIKPPVYMNTEQQAKKEAKETITEEQKQKFYEEALEEAKREAKRKAEESLRKAEEKKKAKEEEKKRKAIEEANKPLGGLFDLL